MNRDRITIGRDSRNDIRIDERWDTVSNEHADIELRGDRLIFTDHSSNGTIINGQKIHHDHVGIYPNDRILLAGVYELDWNIINRYFPNLHRPTVTSNPRGEEKYRQTVRKTVPINSGSGGFQHRQTEPFSAPDHSGGTIGRLPRADNYGQQNAYSQAEIDAAINKWNWGAFFCSWLWAVFHKTYWPLFIFVAFFIPYAGPICGLILSVYLGMNGSKIAWNCGKYRDFQDFKNAQHNWAVAGLIIFLLGIFAQAYVLYAVLSLI